MKVNEMGDDMQLFYFRNKIKNNTVIYKMKKDGDTYIGTYVELTGHFNTDIQVLWKDHPVRWKVGITDSIHKKQITKKQYDAIYKLFLKSEKRFNEFKENMLKNIADYIDKV